MQSRWSEKEQAVRVDLCFIKFILLISSLDILLFIICENVVFLM